MKFIIDIGIIVLFFICYKFYGMYTAIGVTMIAYFLQFAIQTIVQRKVDNFQLALLGFVLILGSATLLFQNELFFKLKPTVVYWLFAIGFYAAKWFGDKKTLLQRLGGQAIILSDADWKILNISWIAFFVCLGFLNLFVAYFFSTDVWVHFKLFGLIGIMLVFILGQVIFIAKRGTKL